MIDVQLRPLFARRLKQIAHLRRQSIELRGGAGETEHRQQQAADKQPLHGPAFDVVVGDAGAARSIEPVPAGAVSVAASAWPPAASQL